MNQKTLYKVFIWGFLALYLFVAGISFCHAIQFFCIGNPMIMSVMLALAFELGLALSLAAVLLSDANKKATLPWILMVVLTFVQVIGNVYSVEKYICESNAVYYQYLQNALLFWIEGVSEQTVQVIVSWIMGAILPIIALFMTDMVASNIKNMNDLKENEVNELPENDEVHQDKQYEQQAIDELQQPPVKEEHKANVPLHSGEDDIIDKPKVEVKNIDPVDVKPNDEPKESKSSIMKKLNDIFSLNKSEETEAIKAPNIFANAEKIEKTDNKYVAQPTYYDDPQKHTK